MKYCILFVCALFPVFALFSDSDTPGEPQLHWLTDYEEAKEQAKAEEKPMLLFFTGSDWCGWCMRLQKEVLSTGDFAERVRDKFIFVELDYPLYQKQEEALVAQNQALRQEFNVRGYPTIVILDVSQRQIGVTGYRRGGGVSYANHLIQLVEEYQALNEAMQDFDAGELSRSEMEDLYRQSKRHGRPDYASAILSAGIAAKGNNFFLVERYRDLVEEGKSEGEEARRLREEILALPVEKESDTHYRLAVIDFQQAALLSHPEDHAGRVLAPLLTYLNSVKHLKPENLWKVHLTIAHVYLSKDLIDKAIEHSMASLELAPESQRGEIRQSLQRLQGKKVAL